MSGWRFARASLLFLCLMAFAWSAPPANAAQAPRVRLENGRLLVGALPDVLSRPEVRPHLTNGLTSTLVVAVTVTDGQGGKARGGGRMDVRYELWDEAFFVSSVGADRKLRLETLPSFERLVGWWRGLELPAVAPDRLSASQPWRVQVRVSLVPFSESEQEDAQKWLSDSVAGGKSSAEQTSASARESPERLGNVLDLLVATSIQRRPLVSYDWNLTLRPENRR
ncbi:MAG TPA: hypothetical protein VHN15_01460 [Thermoanaerobaculia bacterium]|nr:hypothetical protein [Thermoanaerobaculia bacterium]